MNWDQYFLDIAVSVSKKSHCLSIQRGCVIVNEEHQILATGYNGPPAGYAHCSDLDYRAWLASKIDNGAMNAANKKLFIQSNKTCPRRAMGCKEGEGRGHEFCPAVHAEANAIVSAAKVGISVNDCTLYCSFKDTPCRECAKLIINAGIIRIRLLGGPDITPERGIMGIDLLKECGVSVLNGK
jgi:dCMP deaminase